MKNYKIKIYFHSGQADLFGYSSDSVECTASEENKDKILSNACWGWSKITEYWYARR